MSAMNTIITMAALLGGAYVFVTYIMPQLGNLNLNNLIPQPVPLSQTAEGKAYQEVFGDWEEEEEEREENKSMIQRTLRGLSNKGLIPTTTSSSNNKDSPKRVIGEIAAVTNPPCTDLTNPTCIEQMKAAAFRNLTPSSTTTTKRAPSPIGSGWL